MLKFFQNTVLSHDLLEGCYLRTGLVSDVLLLDGYPSKYASYMNRFSRWTRGDWQIIHWIFNKNLNRLSKNKILDNLRRSLFEISIIILGIWIIVLQKFSILRLKSITTTILALITILIFPQILEFINQVAYKKEGEKKQKTFVPQIRGLKRILYISVLNIGTLPYKAYTEVISILKTNPDIEEVSRFEEINDSLLNKCLTISVYFSFSFSIFLLTVIFAVSMPVMLFLYGL